MTATAKSIRHLPAIDSAPAQTEAFTWSPNGELLSAANATQGRHYNKLGQLTSNAALTCMIRWAAGCAST